MLVLRGPAKPLSAGPAAQALGVACRGLVGWLAQVGADLVQCSLTLMGSPVGSPHTTDGVLAVGRALALVAILAAATHVVLVAGVTAQTAAGVASELPSGGGRPTLCGEPVCPPLLPWT